MKNSEPIEWGTTPCAIDSIYRSKESYHRANDGPRQGKMLCKLAEIPHRERNLELLQDSNTIL